MFSSWGDRMDREFDNMMSKPRKYVNSVPPLYNPRRIAERATMPKQYDSEEQRDKLAPRSRYPLILNSGTEVINLLMISGTNSAQVDTLSDLMNPCTLEKRKTSI